MKDRYDPELWARWDINHACAARGTRGPMMMVDYTHGVGYELTAFDNKLVFTYHDARTVLAVANGIASQFGGWENPAEHERINEE